MGISAKDKENIINIMPTSNIYHAIGQNPIVELEHGLFILFPDTKTLALLQIHSASYRELSGCSSQE